MKGFLEQLELWCNMGCRLVATDETYKLFKHSQLERIRRERGCVDRGAVDEDPEKEMSNGATVQSINITVAKVSSDFSGRVRMC